MQDRFFWVTILLRVRAHSYSGINMDSFYKKITFQEISRYGLVNIGDAIMTMAEAEELQAHSNAVSIRLRSAKND